MGYYPHMAYVTSVHTHHSIGELHTILKKSRDEGQRTRLRAIIAALEGNKRKEIAERLHVSDHSVTNWVQAYNTGNVEGLKTHKGGRPEGNPKWEAVLFADLATEIDKGGYWSIPRMQEWLSTKKKVAIPEQTIWYRMDKLNYSYKSARPHPVQGDREKQEAFKKGVLCRSWSR